jgi:anti-sigma regulatory factor (Ser/Thr protein kinase)
MPARTAPGTGAPRSRPIRPRLAPARPPRAFLDVGAVLTAPGCARVWARAILREWGADELADAAELVASEMVTNSVNACVGLDLALIRLVLALDQGELAILVRDDHPGAPVPAQPGADDEGGRGLLIVEHLSDRWGWYPLEDAKPAKVTWAVISAPDLTDAVGLPDAGLAAGARPASALPARRRQISPLTTETRSPGPVHPDILARVKAALERL